MQMRLAMMAVGILAGSQVMFGQSVSVGASSSATSGTTTTVTIPVTVTTPAATTTSAATTTKALLDVTSGTSDGTSGVQTVSQSFMTVALPTVVLDSASAWNTQTNSYTVPVAGTYIVTTKLRLVDGTVAGMNYGLGAATTNTDGPYFLWSTTVGLRNGLLNTRMVTLNKGDNIHMFAYVDFATGARVNSAELIIEQVQ